MAESYITRKGGGGGSVEIFNEVSYGPVNDTPNNLALIPFSRQGFIYNNFIYVFNNQRLAKYHLFNKTNTGVVSPILGNSDTSFFAFFNNNFYGFRYDPAGQRNFSVKKYHPDNLSLLATSPNFSQGSDFPSLNSGPPQPFGNAGVYNYFNAGNNGHLFLTLRFFPQFGEVYSNIRLIRLNENNLALTHTVGVDASQGLSGFKYFNNFIYCTGRLNASGGPYLYTLREDNLAVNSANSSAYDGINSALTAFKLNESTYVGIRQASILTVSLSPTVTVNWATGAPIANMVVHNTFYHSVRDFTMVGAEDNRVIVLASYYNSGSGGYETFLTINRTGANTYAVVNTPPFQIARVPSFNNVRVYQVNNGQIWYATNTLSPITGNFTLFSVPYISNYVSINNTKYYQK
jgi:hypothetical protein